MHCPLRKKRPKRDSDFSAIVVPSMYGSGYLDYTVETHASKSMKVMDEFRQHEMLCDLVLHVTYKEKTVDFKVAMVCFYLTITSSIHFEATFQHALYSISV